MNRKILLACLLVTGMLVMSSCDKDDKAAISSFEVSKTKADAGESLIFTNKSSNAKAYVWDFGDGSSTSLEVSPTHSYSQVGTYTVTLTAKGDGGNDVVTQKISIVNPITVFEGYGIQEVSLGDSWSSLQKVFGDVFISEVMTQYDDLTYRVDAYSASLGLEFVFFTVDSTIAESDVVQGIFIWSPYLANTSNGVALGDNISEAKVYGTAETDSYDDYSIYMYASYGLMFYVDSKSLIEIMLVTFAESKKSANEKSLFTKPPKLLMK